MCALRIIDRESGNEIEEEVPYEGMLRFMYSGNPFAPIVLFFLCKLSWFSKLFGALQSRTASKKHIIPFIETYKVDVSEFAKKPEDFRSFNAFFTRKLQPSARPLKGEKDQPILPADGRVLCFPKVGEFDPFFVKGKEFTLSSFLQDGSLAKQYENGSMLMVRLAPVDYHRFHFPCNCIPKPSKLINGPLYSVNPIALKEQLSILCENKRVITPLETKEQGTILYVEIGATNVGSIIQTFEPNIPCARGEEKGFFSFGGSCIVLLFEPGKITFDEDLVTNSKQGLETLCKMGQSLGRFQAL